MAKYYRGLNVSKQFVCKTISKRTIKDYSPPYIDDQAIYGYGNILPNNPPPNFTSNTGGAGCQCSTPPECAFVSEGGYPFHVKITMQPGQNSYGSVNSAGVDFQYNTTDLVFYANYNYGTYDWYEKNKVAYRVYMSPTGSCTEGNYCADNYQSLIYSGIVYDSEFDVANPPAYVIRAAGNQYGSENAIVFTGPSGGYNLTTTVQYTGGTGVDNWGKAGWYKFELDGPGGSTKSRWIALYTYEDDTTSYECNCTNEGCTCDPGGYTQTEACCCYDCSGDGITCCDDGGTPETCCRAECSPGDPGYACGYNTSCDPPNTENCSPGGCDTCYVYCYTNCTDVKGTCT